MQANCISLRESIFPSCIQSVKLKANTGKLFRNNIRQHFLLLNPICNQTSVYARRNISIELKLRAVFLKQSEFRKKIGTLSEI